MRHARGQRVVRIAAVAIIVGTVLFVLIGSNISGNQPSRSSVVVASHQPIDRFPALKADLSGTNNDAPPVPYLRHFTYDKEAHTVTVDFNMDQNLTDDLTKTTLRGQIADILIALYHQDHIPLAVVHVNAYEHVQDAFGNVSYQDVYGVSLTRAVASKINWTADTAVLEQAIIPGLWMTTHNRTRFM